MCKSGSLMLPITSWALERSLTKKSWISRFLNVLIDLGNLNSRLYQNQRTWHLWPQPPCFESLGSMSWRWIDSTFKRVKKNMWETFSLNNIGATYQILMNHIFHGKIGRNMDVYVDDMIVKSNNPKQHVINLTEVFGRLREFDTRLDLEKCVSELKGECISIFF